MDGKYESIKSQSQMQSKIREFVFLNLDDHDIKEKSYFRNIIVFVGMWWLMPVNSSTQETKIGRIRVWDQPGQTILPHGNYLCKDHSMRQQWSKWETLYAKYLK
jgi:hypothetical protein